MPAEQFSDTSLDPPVRGFLHRPDRPNGSALVLTHGAGGNAKGALIVALSEAFAGAGFIVLRCELPYRQQRSFGPPRPTDAVRDRLGLKHAVSCMRKLANRVFLGGHSYGGRQATMLCAEEPGLVEGLLPTSYPLHPPGRPAQLRTQHFAALQTQALFVEGTKDPFATIEEIRAALPLIPAKTKLMVVEGVGHDLGFKPKSKHGDLPNAILTEFLAFFR